MEENQEVQIIQADTIGALARAEQESAMDIARRYPRDISQTKKDLLSYATCDQETAEGCFYSKPVGKDKKGVDQFAEGPSIRLAEMVAATYGNITYGSRVLGVEQDFVTVQGVAMDIQKNIRFSSDVKRSIKTRDGKRYGQNQIEVTIKAASAIAVRDAIYKVVPMGIFSQEIKRIKEVAAGIVNSDGKKASPEELSERAKKAIAFFVNRGVDPQRIFNSLRIKSADDIKGHHLVTLTGFKTALGDGEAELDELFPPVPAEQKASEDKKKQDAIKNQVIPTKKEEPVQEAEEVNEPEPEAKEEPNVNTDFAIMVDDEVKKWKTVYGVTTDQICEKFKVEHVHLMTEANVRELEKWRAEILAGSMVFKGLFNDKK